MMQKIEINLDKFKEMWPAESMDSILEYFKVKKSYLYQLAYKHKIKRIKKDHNLLRDLSFLIDDSLESFYWTGFILADGCIHKSYLFIKLQYSDLSHLEKLQKKINCNITESFSNSNFGTNKQCQIQVSHKTIIDQLKVKFDIKENKTYNPPNTDLWNFSEKQLISLFIGFLDGDGSLSYHERFFNFDVSGHASWVFFYQFMRAKLIAYFQSENSEVCFSKRGLCRLRLSQYNSCKLYDFTVQNNLPVLGRKWNKIPKHRKYLEYLEYIDAQLLHNIHVTEPDIL